MGNWIEDQDGLALVMTTALVPPNKILKIRPPAWHCGSVVQHLPSVCEALASIPSTAKRKEGKEIKQDLQKENFPITISRKKKKEKEKEEETTF
jgi:hypothetical protein